eukprot:14509954-Heterocapsa_arctica.AAC.1
MLWDLSAGLPVPKHNAKTGCASLRVLHLLDPFGKDWNSMIWERYPKPWEDNSMGYIPGRRREEASLVIRAEQWHLSASRLGF